MSLYNEEDYGQQPPPYSPSSSVPTRIPPPSYSERTPLFSDVDSQPRQYTNPPKYDDDEQSAQIPPEAGRKSAILIIIFLIALLFRTFWVFAIGSSRDDSLPPRVVNIAIIGAGPAGISTASTLSHLKFQNKKGSPDIQTNITIFELKDHVGGRMALGPSVSATDGPGWKIHPEDIAAWTSGNRIIRQKALSKFGFQLQVDMDSKTAECGKATVGFFDGRDMVADMNRPRDKMPWGNWLGLVFKYGASVWRAIKLPDGTKGEFNSMLQTIFNKLENRFIPKVYESPWEMVMMGGLTWAVSLSANERLAKNGIGGNYVEEVLRPQVKRQNGLELEELSDLGLSMALEREDFEFCPNTEGGKLMQILESFTTESRATLQPNTRVAGLGRELVEEGKSMWIIKYFHTETDEQQFDAFDKVIIAAPWNTTSLLPTDAVETQEPIIYIPVWITLVSTQGSLSSQIFGRSPETMPSQILPITSSTDLPTVLDGIHEITHLRKIFSMGANDQLYNTNLYRILSDKPLSNETLKSLWEKEVDEVYSEKIENAYPITYPRSSGDGLGNFKLHDGIWHTSVVEGVASTVDFAWVAGETVGRLVGREIEHERI